MFFDEPIQGWAAFGCSIQGASHQRSQPLVPCQDAYLITSGTVMAQPYLVAAVADGHGDKKYDRSQLGAALAVQAAAHEFYKFCVSHGHFPPDLTSKRRELFKEIFCRYVDQQNLEVFGAAAHEPPVLRDIFLEDVTREWQATLMEQGINPGPTPLKQLVEEFKTEFPKTVMRSWRRRVQQDYEINGEGSRQYTRYGTTLIFAGITAEELYLAQLGDGDIILLSKTGEAERVFELPQKDVGGVTQSLSSPDADKLMQVHYKTLDDDLAAIILATDGLVNCFGDDDAFFNFLRAITDNLDQYPMKQVAGMVQEKLPELSQQGSGDDITVTVLFRPNILRKPTPEVPATEEPTPAPQEAPENPSESEPCDPATTSVNT